MPSIVEVPPLKGELKMVLGIILHTPGETPQNVLDFGIVLIPLTQKRVRLRET
jgi:hypothetical protein